MNLKHKLAILSGLALALLSTTGCAVYRNPVSIKPHAAIAAQWQVQYPIDVCVKNPQARDFSGIRSEMGQRIELQIALDESRRMVEVLNQCHLFKSVRLSDADAGACDLRIAALPRTQERTGSDDPMALIYLGILPVYLKENESINFQFLGGESDDFRFPWTEECFIGFWSPVVRVAGDNWQYGHSSSLYWVELRKALIKKFDQIRR
jgi:hypothetical protein